MLFCRPLIFFKIIFSGIPSECQTDSGIPSECQTDWIQIRPDVLSGLIWVQSVCKCYERTTLVGNKSVCKCYEQTTLVGNELMKHTDSILTEFSIEFVNFCL